MINANKSNWNFSYHGGRLPTVANNFAGEGLLEVAVNLDARDAVPGQLHELVNAHTAPLVISQSGDISKSNMLFWIVFTQIPGA